MLIDLLLRLHRWISLTLAPLFLVILLSGAVLALEPILGVGAAKPAEAVDTGALIRLLDRLDIAASARMLHMSHDGRSVELRFGHRTPPVTVDIATGEAVPDAEDEGVFGVARALHETLLIGAKPVVEWSAWAMVALTLTGPFLAWPRLRNTVSGWHSGLGWVLFPLVLLPSGTAVLRSLDVGHPALVEPAPSVPPLRWAEGLAKAAAAGDLSHIDMARRMPGGGLAIMTESGTRVVTRAGVTSAARGGNWVKDLHDGVWAAPWSGWVSLASSIVVLALLGTGTTAWIRRLLATRRRSGDADAALLVAHASQTGTAARFAETTAETLRQSGATVATASLAALQPEHLTRYRAVLLIASTTGEGQPPETARRFLHALRDSNLSGVGVAMLALGDSRYQYFCAGGEMLRAALLSAGAQELLPMQRADRDVGATWQPWLRAVTACLQMLPAAAVATPEADRPVSLVLQSRVRLDNPAHGETNEVWSLTLRSDHALDYRPGDLLLIAPDDGQPERCYSIGGAAAADGTTLRLTVSLVSWIADDGQARFGRTSLLLCRTWPDGMRIAAWLRRHPQFNPPADPMRPVIMVATGCGIAPFVGFLAERAAAGRHGDSWLIFGNRYRDGDFLYADRVQDALRAGVLSRLDTAFSRDADDGRHVQDCLAEQAAELWDWLTRRDAVLYACGRLSTLGSALDGALSRIAQSEGGLSAADAEALLVQWRADGRLRRDLFD